VLTYDELRLDRRQFLALTGLTVKEFQWLLPTFQAVYARQHSPERTQGGKTRLRRVGGGRKSVLGTIEQKLLFVLVYQKTYPLQSVIASLFGLSQSRANRWIHELLPLLRDALTDLQMMPERDAKRFARSERKHMGSATMIIDGTERRRQRPQNKDKQQLHYSGRKKAHSDKNVVIADAKSKRIGYLSQTYSGKTQDKKIVDFEPIAYPRHVTLYKDTGFQGYEPRVRQTQQPKKSPARRS
jgi:hypothetical protein